MSSEDSHQGGGERRGRKPRTEVDAVRTRFWAEIVMTQTRLGVRELDARCGAASSGQWSKYAAGTSSPSPSRLAQIESLFPGTTRYYTSPFWDLIAPETLGVESPRPLFQWLNEPLRSRFTHDRLRGDLFWRKPSQLDDDLLWLMNSDFTPEQPFDVFVALLALVHESVSLQAVARFTRCERAWREFFRNVRYDLRMSRTVGEAWPEELLLDFGWFIRRRVEQLAKSSAKNAASAGAGLP